MDREILDKIKLSSERLDDLQSDDLFVLQNPNGYCFTSDSVLLANFAKTKKNDKVLEICAGCGVVSILMNSRHNFIKADLIEIQSNLAELSRKNIELNELQTNFKVFNIDALNLFDFCEKSSYDVVVCNPPYEKLKHNNKDEEKNYKVKMQINFEKEKLQKNNGIESITNDLLKTINKNEAMQICKNEDNVNNKDINVIECASNDLSNAVNEKGLNKNDQSVFFNDRMLLNEEIFIARSEEKIKFKQIIEISSKALKFGKPFYFIHKAERFAEIIKDLEQFDFKLKKVQFVHTKKDMKSRLFLGKAVLKAKEGIEIMPPLILCDDYGNESEQIKNIYNRK